LTTYNSYLILMCIIKTWLFKISSNIWKYIFCCCFIFNSNKILYQLIRNSNVKNKLKNNYFNSLMPAVAAKLIGVFDFLWAGTISFALAMHVWNLASTSDWLIEWANPPSFNKEMSKQEYLKNVFLFKNLPYLLIHKILFAQSCSRSDCSDSKCNWKCTFWCFLSPHQIWLKTWKHVRSRFSTFFL